MVALATTERVKRNLYIDFDDDDDLIEFYIAAASEAVIGYLKGQADAILDLDSGGELTSGSEIPARIEWATVLLAGYMYRNRDSDEEKAFEMGYLPKPVMALLYPLRDPALA